MYYRGLLAQRFDAVRRQVAAEFGCDPQELALTRNASESLHIAQAGIDLRPGDEVISTDQDNPRMLWMWDQRARRIVTVVDGAQAVGHFPVNLHDLGCDVYGTSLHKWLMAPHGTGFLYVRQNAIERLWPLQAALPAVSAALPSAVDARRNARRLKLSTAVHSPTNER